MVYLGMAIIATEIMNSFRQLLRYGIIGLVFNGLGFLLYLTLTHFGMGPKLAMSLLYAIGVLQTFVFNKQWTFAHQGTHGAAFVRYCTVYGMGYFVNWAALFLLVDKLGLPHQLVQCVMIFVVAAMLFMALKFWVFHKASVGAIT